MRIECQDRERVLRDSQPAEMQALAEHAENCNVCAQELRLWNEISSAARTMHAEWESPYLWLKIRRSLETEMQSAAGRPAWSPWRMWQFAGREWHAAVAVLVLALMTASGAWLVRRMLMNSPVVSQPGQTTDAAHRCLLTEQAVLEADTAEAAYLKSIDKLSSLAEPKLEHPATPLMASYREKLLLLDAAIAECRANIEKNRWNARLRRELLSVYHEKQQTLEEVVQEE
jgi:hypothetical protein